MMNGILSFNSPSNFLLQYLFLISIHYKLQPLQSLLNSEQQHLLQRNNKHENLGMKMRIAKILQQKSNYANCYSLSDTSTFQYPEVSKIKGRIKSKTHPQPGLFDIVDFKH